MGRPHASPHATRTQRWRTLANIQIQPGQPPSVGAAATGSPTLEWDWDLRVEHREEGRTAQDPVVGRHGACRKLQVHDVVGARGQQPIFGADFGENSK